MYTSHVAESVRRARRSWLIAIWFLRVSSALALSAFAGYVPYRLYVRVGFAQHLALHQELRELTEKNERIRRENQDLRFHLTRIQKDESEIERVARDELGFIHSDELLFKVEQP